MSISTEDAIKIGVGVLAFITGVLTLRTAVLNFKKGRREAAQVGDPAVRAAPNHFAISCHPDFDATDNVRLFLQTFRERTPKWAENSWEDDRRKEILPDASGGYVVPYERVRELLRHESYPFKFFVLVPAALRNKYYDRMVDADCIVTGKGVQDADVKYWRIWFVMPNGVIHPDIEEPWRINHCLPGRRGL